MSVPVLCGALAALTVLGAATTVRRPPTRSPARPAPGGGRAGGSLRRPGLVAGAALVGLLVAPPLALLPPVVGWARRRTLAVRRRRVEQRRIAETLPDAVDLLLLGTAAGWTLPVAHPRVAGRLPPPLGPALTVAATVADRGQPRAEALVEALSPLGERAQGLAHVLADHLRYGVPLAPALERLGLELRLDRRRRAELEARRVPVRLLGPLVLCILPAFALLTVVPLLAASLRALPT